MGISIGHACGRGRGGRTSTQMVTLRCDAPACHARVVSWSKEEFDHQQALGWRIGPQMPGGGKLVCCPEHSEAEPTVPVQTELSL